MEILKNLARAIQFLTVFPLPSFSYFSHHPDQEEETLAENFAPSMAFFPLVGMLIGLVLVALRWIFNFLPLSPLVSNTLILLIWIGMSGGLHLDGFADSVDGFLGGHNQEEILKIMKDSAIGAKGVLALISLLLLKLALLIELPLEIKDGALFFAPIMGRWSMVLGTFLGKPARSENSMGKLFMDYLSWREVALASVIMAVAGIWLFKLYFLLLLVLGIGIVAGVLKYCQKRISGITGDILGAINEIVEVFILLTLEIVFLY